MTSISCSFSTLVNQNSSCGQTATSASCISLGECQRDVSYHLSFLNVFGDANTDSEMKLILARAGEHASTFVTFFINLIYFINTKNVKSGLFFIFCRLRLLGLIRNILIFCHFRHQHLYKTFVFLIHFWLYFTNNEGMNR